MDRSRWPREGQKYFYINSILFVESDTFTYISDLDKYRKKAGNCFDTELEAETAAQRIYDMLVPDHG